MGAALAGVGRVALGAVVGGGASRLGNVDPATATVRLGRVIYVAGLGYVAFTWYWAWRNERVDAGSGEFPIPGIYKGGKTRDGAADADDAGPIYGSASDASSASNPSAAQDLPHGSAGNPTLAPGVGGSSTLLVRLGRTAETAFGLHVSEHPAFGGVHPVHVQGSLHYQNRAFDAGAVPVNSATLGRASAYAHWLVNNYLSQLTQVIWNGPNPIFVYHGKIVSASVYADVLATHKTHVHVGI